MREQKSSSEPSMSLCGSSGELEACLPGAPSQACRPTSSPSGVLSSDEGEEPLAGEDPVAAPETLEQFLQSGLLHGSVGTPCLLRSTLSQLRWTSEASDLLQPMSARRATVSGVSCTPCV